MSRRYPRVRARFVATVEIGGVDHTLICHTRDISLRGCFLATSEMVADGVELSMAVMDNERGEAVSVSGKVTRMLDTKERGIGVELINPPHEWSRLVAQYQQLSGAGHEVPHLRLAILVVSSEENRRGALALYVTSGWDIRFAVDVATAQEAMEASKIDAVICEFEADDPTWHAVMERAREKHPRARRLVRCRSRGSALPESGTEHLAHRFVESEEGIDALVDALNEGQGDRQSVAAMSSIDAVPLSKPAAQETLGQIIAEIRSHKDSLAVFDLDSTLLDNGPRQAAILREYGAEHALLDLMQSKAEHWVSWDVEDAMTNAGLSREGVEKHRDAFKEYWRERFFTSQYCKLDEAIIGAAAFVRSIREAGGQVYYVTGRHEEMRDGSVACLARLGFPVPSDEGVRLLMKPTLAEDDDTYKLRTYSELKDHGTVVAAFDNEPTHINGYRNAFPSAQCIHLATDHSGRDVKVLPGVISIWDFASR